MITVYHFVTKYNGNEYIIDNNIINEGLNALYFFLGVVIAIVIGNSFIIFAESDSKVIYSNWVLIINSLVAVGLSAMILIKDKDREDGEVDKANILLAVGLVFWFIANVIWAYYELVLDIVSPVLP